MIRHTVEVDADGLLRLVVELAVSRLCIVAWQHFVVLDPSTMRRPQLSDFGLLWRCLVSLDGHFPCVRHALCAVSDERGAVICKREDRGRCRAALMAGRNGSASTFSSPAMNNADPPILLILFSPKGESRRIGRPYLAPPTSYGTSESSWCNDGMQRACIQERDSRLASASRDSLHGQSTVWADEISSRIFRLITSNDPVLYSTTG